ncbi:MAG: hypothetical protein HY791_32475 [Deltaproteobacteria bacterium]|nr:hypothetical protein [Deltaproteobacteria bacterium]
MPLLGLLAACHQDRVTLEWSDPSESVVVAVLSDPLLVYGFASTPMTFEAPEGVAEVFVLTYGAPLQALELREGQIHGTSDPLGLTLPPAERVLRAELSGDSWVESALPGAIASFRYPRISAYDCAEGGGCYTGDVDRRCVTPCSAPEPPEPPEPPTSPSPPEPPRQLPCPIGYEALTASDGPPYCAPAEAECDFPSVWVPGEVGCLRLGTECPAGLFAESVPPGPVIYVASGATAGDGSIERPFSRVAEATAVARSGDSIALSRGEFGEPVDLPEGVHLIGACPSGTVLSTPVDVEFTIRSGSPGVRISNLTVRGAGRGILVQGAGSEAELDGVVIEGPGDEGLFVLDGASVTMRRSLIWHRRRAGVAVIRARAELDRTRLSDLEGMGLYVDSSTLSMAHSVVTRLRDGDTNAGNGLLAGASIVTIEESLFEGSSAPTIFADQGADVTISRSLLRADPERRVELVDALGGARVELGRVTAMGAKLLYAHGEAEIRATDFVSFGAPVAVGDAGSGLGLSGGTIVLERAWISNLELSVRVLAGSLLAGTDVELRGSGAAHDMLSVASGSRAVLSRVRITNAGGGITYADSALALTDAAIQIQGGPWSGIAPSGVEAAGALELRRVRLESEGFGIFIAKGVSSATIADALLVSHAADDGDPSNAAGLVTMGGSKRLRLERVTLQWPFDVPFSLNSDDVIVTDLNVDGSHVRGGDLGAGVIELSRVSVHDVLGCGLIVRPNVSAAFSDLSISNVRAVGCRPDGSLILSKASTVDVSEFEIVGGGGPAVRIGATSIDLQEAPVAHLSDGSIRDNAIGIAVASPGFELEPLLLRVKLADNDKAVDRPTESE